MQAGFSVFAHLNAEKSAHYRGLLEVFVAERGRFAIALRPGEIQSALASRGGEPPPLAEIESALRQLKDWGNLDDAPDTAEVSTVEEFYRQRRLYQLSAEGEAAEAALAVFAEHLQRPGELQAAALHDILELLDALPPLLAEDPLDDAKLHHALTSLTARFEQLTARAQTFMREVQRTVDLHGIEVSAFLAYKEKLIDYLERFIGELVVASNRIAATLLDLEACGVRTAFAAAARRELVDALEGTPEMLAGAAARWEARWTGLRRWFIGESSGHSQAELLRARARAAIPALLTAVTQINDRRASRADRAADFATLARWFAEAPDDDAAHRLWRVAFALSPARHLRINEETLAARAQADESPRTSWLGGTPMWVSPRLRQTGRHAMRGAAQPVIDRSREKAHLLQLALEQTAELLHAREKLLRGGRRRLAQMGPMETAEFRLFLDLLGHTLSRQPPGPVLETMSADGTLQVRLEPIDDGGAMVELLTSEGVFRGGDHWVTIEPA